MALADLDAFIAAAKNPAQDSRINIPILVSVAGRWYDTWVGNVPAGTAPSTAAAPSSATAGAMDLTNSGAGTLGIIGSRLNTSAPMTYMICDRLSHQGGLAGNVATTQTTNLPTAALTRYTSGVGVMAMLSVYSQVGTTGTTATVSYTNQAGTTGQTSPTIAFGGTGFREVSRGLLLPLAAGDTGVRSVESVTLAVSTTAAGNFGVTLFKPIAMIFSSDTTGIAANGLINGGMLPGLAEVQDDACLFVLAMSTTTAGTGVGAVLLTEW